MHSAPRGIRSVTRVTVMWAVLVVFLAEVAPAHASQSGLTTSPTEPVVGDTVTANGPSRECELNKPATYAFTFTRNSTVVASGSGTYNNSVGGVDFSATVSQAGTYTVTEEAQCPQNSTSVHSIFTAQFTVGAGLDGSIAVSPDPPVVNQSADLNVVPTGGNPGYAYSWDLNNDGTFGDAVTHNPTTTFTTTGSHVVKVRLSDNDQHNFQITHTTTITRTLNVVTASGPPPPPPPPCNKRVAFKLSAFTTAGCFTETSVVAFSRSLGASRYSVSAKLSDGRELAFDLGGRCRAVRITNISTGVAAAVKIVGVRYDLAMGRARTISISANRQSAGRIGKKWRPGKICT